MTKIVLQQKLKSAVVLNYNSLHEVLNLLLSLLVVRFQQLFLQLGSFFSAQPIDKLVVVFERLLLEFAAQRIKARVSSFGFRLLCSHIAVSEARLHFGTDLLGVILAGTHKRLEFAALIRACRFVKLFRADLLF